jgi:hypothetical protein
MTIRLTEKAFTEKYKDSESAEFQELSNELINSVSDCLMPHICMKSENDQQYLDIPS